MKSIAFIDTEIDPKTKRVLDLGSIKSNGAVFHSPSITAFTNFIAGSQFVCGHNIFNHDIKYIQKSLNEVKIEVAHMIDTLYLSPLFFPRKPYHALLKDDKLQTEERNNPLNDSIKARDLFYDELAAFQNTEVSLRRIYFLLLRDKREFSAFFDFIGFECRETNVEQLIREKFHSDICSGANLGILIASYPSELAYCLSLIYARSRLSITPPWVLKNYPEVEQIMYLLRNKACLTGCGYCKQALDIHNGLKRFFGFDAYRTYGREPLQEKAVKAAIDNKSILAVFPTGGGKSITFQVPALMAGENAKGLTVVISPLQSLMKDQVDNLEKIGITDAVTINGLLDPIERANSFERVQSGAASILYISPESLRSKTIEHLLLGRNIIRFVIDEAHCFSSWGQDFRVDYLYIGDFIQALQVKKNRTEGIPVSCFTATAKQKVIEDICDYFREKLSLELKIFSSNTSRTNLQYKVYPKYDEEQKYNTVRNLIEEKNCPTIVYVSRTYKAYKLAERLSDDGFQAKPYHGKMEKQEKTENQDAFINGDVQIMVATSAFGMGVDKKDVGMVVHYEISDSLENYVQEAGRAGRDENITADCFVLFNEEDLSKHFILLNQTKLSIKEIQQVWNAIKYLTRFRSSVSNSALEIARKAGWNDSIDQIESRVKTAISALEEAGYLKRGQNMPRIYANSILTKNAQEAIDKINASGKFQPKQKQHGVRIIKKLFSSKSKSHSSNEEAESRVDYLSDHLGIVKEEVINIIRLLREENILADAKDLTAFIKKGENKNKSLATVEAYGKIENFLLSIFQEEEKSFQIKELNEKAEENGCEEVSPNKIKTIINFWVIKNWIKRKTQGYSKTHLAVVCIQPKENLKVKLKKRHELAIFLVDFLYARSFDKTPQEAPFKEQVLIEFSVHELKKAYEDSSLLFKFKVTIEDIEDTLFYLSRIEAIKIEGGFLVVYNSMTIERIEKDNKIRYKVEDYQKLDQFYENKVQQIHIVGEYAKRMISDYTEALQFVEDYFQLNYSVFLNKYFKGSRQNEIKRNITPTKFRQLFGELSPRQLKIIKDNHSKNIVVAAGPGSGKTRVLVHKLASLLLMEDVKHEQLLMVTFSRAAASEFKQRLLKLIGNAANFIEIKTFHSYCFDLLGKIGNLDKSLDIIKRTVEKITSGEVETNRITKTVLVIDEAQDMDADEFALVNALMKRNEDMRVIAVGDDDQNIYEFRGASSKYLQQFIHEKQAIKHELIENYRSQNNLVEFTNQFIERLQNRLKSSPIKAVSTKNGEVRLVKHKGQHLISPFVNDIINAEIRGTTCVLTRSNDEALQITGMLLKNNIPAKLIQSNESFNLYNLLEVRFFLNQLELEEDVYVINEDVWKEAKRALWKKYRGSSKIEICINLIKEFEASNPKKRYKTDFVLFIRESKLEDFITEKGDTIYVSTIHKAKGKEFDNVFLLLQNLNHLNSQEIRLLYVAMTRAKQKLSIHLNEDFLDKIIVADLLKIDDHALWPEPDIMVMQLSYKDVWLGYFKSTQYRTSELKSGDELHTNNGVCFNKEEEPILKFSKKFCSQMGELIKRGYQLSSVKVNFIVYWKDEETEKEFKVVLPELHFKRTPHISSNPAELGNTPTLNY
ncbi:RecQ family ATP-dependent DNA helicase [uncultured Cyclobacterium sp.]|uniref:RecQ family ATP-dependent DNA helicase n=1 Tax=uncultured Cyclobacterium sp. TaxID=453820 RepID=UPI0030EF5378|tara:strand:- start:3690 stop:8546 length:4857 start_codon:yes stop_codon:yes gene_type:complete